MTRRGFTVGSLIPGRMVAVNKQSTPVLTKNEKPQPGKIVVQQNGNRLEIQPIKGTLLEAAINQGIPIEYKCRKGTCGQCTVKVVQGPGLSEPNEKEQIKLMNNITNGYRLACQVEIL